MAVEYPTLPSVARTAAAQGYILLPLPKVPVTLGTCFSSSLASKPTDNPFLDESLPFDQEAFESSEFLYDCRDNCRGTFLSSATSSAASSSEHLSLSLGVSVGNSILGASVTGSYDKTVLNDTSSSKMSRRTSFQAGGIRFKRPPALSKVARDLLSSSDAGVDTFTQQYGDFYISGFTIGGEAAILVSQSMSKSQSAERMKVQVEVQVLCFSDTYDVADLTIAKAALETRFNVLAFDSIDQSFVNMSAQQGNPVGLEEAQRLVKDYSLRVDQMPKRIEQQLSGVKSLLSEGTSLSWGDVNFLLQSDVVSHLVLVPFSSLRDFKQTA